VSWRRASSLRPGAAACGRPAHGAGGQRQKLAAPGVAGLRHPGRREPESGAEQDLMGPLLCCSRRVASRPPAPASCCNALP